MAQIQFPQNDNARSQLLRKCIHATTQQEVRLPVEVLVPEELIAKGNELLPLFNERLSDVNALLSHRSKEVAEKQEALSRLNTWLRDFWEVLRRRTSRLDHPAQVLSFYQLPLSGVTPQLSKEKDMLEVAQRVVDGDKAANQAGYPPMVNPSVEELKTVLDAAWKEVGDVPMADQAYDRAQENIANIRSQVDDLIRDLYDHLNFNLRKKEAAGRRRILQNYGFTFRYLKGEPVDEEVSAN